MSSIDHTSESSSDRNEEQHLATARIGAAHGVAGFVALHSLSGEVDHLLRLADHAAPVSLRHPRSGGHRELAIDALRQLGQKVIVRFAGTESREAVRELTDWELWVPRSLASTLGPEEYYAADLCGCAVFRGAVQLGTVAHLIEGGATDLLEVAAVNGGSFMVPFTERFVPTVDIDARRMELADDMELP